MTITAGPAHHTHSRRFIGYRPPTLDVDAEARETCRRHQQGFVTDVAARHELMALFGRTSVVKQLVNRAVPALSVQESFDLVEAITQKLVDNIGGEGSAVFDLHSGQSSSFTGWCRQFGKTLLSEMARKQVTQQKRMTPVPHHTNDPVAPSQDERLRLICDELEDRSVWRRGSVVARANALVAGLQLPAMRRIDPETRNRLHESAAGADFPDKAMLSFLVAGKVTAATDPLIQELVQVWGNWDAGTVNWFIAEYDSAMVKESVVLLMRSVIEPLPRPPVMALRRAGVVMKKKPGTRNREFIATSELLVQAWVDRNCDAHEVLVGKINDDAERERRMMEVEEQVAQSWRSYSTLLAEAAKAAKVTTGQVERWMEQSLAESKAWPCDVFHDVAA